MQLEVQIDRSYTEPKVIVVTASMTEEVHLLLSKLQEQAPQMIVGSKDSKVEIIKQADLIRIYASAGNVFAVTYKGEYTLRLQLYEIEKRLSSYQFVRISRSEIINLKHVSHFDLNVSGTICVQLSNGTVTYVSRRSVSKIKNILGI